MTALVKKYIKFSQYVEDVKFGYAINSQEWAILLIIATADIECKNMKVKDLLKMDHIASPATIHKMIKLLIAKKLLRVQSDTNDARIKFIRLTTKGLNLLHEVGKKMWLRNTSFIQ